MNKVDKMYEEKEKLERQFHALDTAQYELKQTMGENDSRVKTLIELRDEIDVKIQGLDYDIDDLLLSIS